MTNFFLTLSYAFLEPQGDRIKGSKKKPENIKFPPYSKKPPAKKEDCGDEENVGEEGEAEATTSPPASAPGSQSTTTTKPASTTTTTTVKPPSESVSVGSDESSVAEAKPGENLVFKFHEQTLNYFSQQLG